MNTYQIHYFGLLSERRGLADETIASATTTARDLYAHTDLRVAVNDEMVGWDHPLTNGDQIAFLPPMSGG